MLARGAAAEEKAVYSGACSANVDQYFANEVWAKVGAQVCLECNKIGGDAEESDFILNDPQLSQGSGRDEAMRRNRDAFTEMARAKEGDQSRLLLKVVGKLKHGGKQVIKPESAGDRVLAEFVSRLSARPTAETVARLAAAEKDAPPFFDRRV